MRGSSSTGWGIKESDVKADFLKPNQAAEKMRDGGMDAFFFVGGYPTSAITELAATGGGIDIVPIAGAQAEAIRKQYTFFSAGRDPGQHLQERRCRQRPSPSGRSGSPPPRCRRRSSTR